MEERKINMLADTESYGGFTKGTLKPTVMFLIRVCILPIAYVAVLFHFTPFIVFIILEGIIVIRSALVVFGNEPKKVDAYIKNQNDDYNSVSEGLEVTNKFDDGLIKYMNGEVMYTLIAEMGNLRPYPQDIKMKKAVIHRLMTLGTLSVRAFNKKSGEVITESRSRKLRSFKGEEVQKAYAHNLDYAEECTDNNSKLYRLYFTITTREANFKKLREGLYDMMGMPELRVFKNVRLATRDEMDKLLSRDVDAPINDEKLLRDKYSDMNKLNGARIVGYGDDVEAFKGLLIRENEPIGEIGGFMRSE